jgi:hypothetical protein
MTELGCNEPSKTISNKFARPSRGSSSAPWLLVVSALALAGCPASTTPENDGSVPSVDGSSPDAQRSDAGPPWCTSDGECADSVDCTTDTCVPTSGSCRHVVTPALCGAGESCDPVEGCTPGRPCGTDTDCEDDDPCTVSERCDPAARVCTFLPLDGDGDGDPPRVCGGGDCDDSLSEVSSLDVENCAANGVDNDCDGTVDESEGAAGCGAGQYCRDNRCVCSSGPEEPCRGMCPDYATDPNNCGLCGTVCGSGSCSAGVCLCPTGETACAVGRFECFDLSSDPNHCGSCDTVCPTGASCAGGTCGCPGGGMVCDGACTDTMSDRVNCGACGRICESGTCSAGRCMWSSCPTPFTTCGGVSTCTFYDPLNCGSCGTTCSPGEHCARGTCFR